MYDVGLLNYKNNYYFWMAWWCSGLGRRLPHCNEILGFLDAKLPIGESVSLSALW